MITTPYSAAVVALLYFDLRVRKEGLDLQLLARDAGVERDPDAPLPAPLHGDEWTPEERAQAPYWPPPPGWKPEPRAPAPPAPPAPGTWLPPRPGGRGSRERPRRRARRGPGHPLGAAVPGARAARPVPRRARPRGRVGGLRPRAVRRARAAGRPARRSGCCWRSSAGSAALLVAGRLIAPAPRTGGAARAPRRRRSRARTPTRSSAAPARRRRAATTSSRCGSASARAWCACTGAGGSTRRSRSPRARSPARVGSPGFDRAAARFDEVVYGRRPAAAGDVDAARAAWDEALR